VRRRRRWLAWMLAIAALAIAVHWLLSPGVGYRAHGGATPISETDDATGLAGRGRNRRTRLGDLVAWIRQQLEGRSEPELPPAPFDPAPVLGAPGTLEVVVRQEGGSAIAGARVVVFGPPGAPLIPARSTDAEGRVVFPGLPSGPGYDVHVDFPRPDSQGEDLGRCRATVRAGEATHLVMERPSLRVEGEVLDEATREPVAEAEVEAFDLGDVHSIRQRDAWEAWTGMTYGTVESAPPVLTTLTESDGRFLLDAGTLERVQLRARAEDGRTGSCLVTRDSSRWSGRILVSMQAVRRCEGIVADAAGRPQPGLRLWAPAAIARSGDAPSTTTDSEGRFSLPVLTAGTTARLVVEGEGVPRFSVRVLADRNARIVVPGSAALDVLVIEDGSDRPLAGAHVVAHVGSTTTEATTDAKGRARVGTEVGPIFLLRVFATGSGEITLTPDGHSPATTEPANALQSPLGAGETRSVTVRARRSALVVGRVLHPEGGPAEHVSVALTTGWGGREPTASSGPDGRFTVRGCIAPPHWWTRPVRAHGDGGAEGTFEVSVPTDAAALASGAIDVGDVTLRRGAVVRTQVLDPEGNPIPGAVVSGHVGAMADADGWLALAIRADTSPSRTLEFDVAAPGFRTRTMRCSAALASGEVRDLPPIRLERGRPVAVRILDASGRPVAGCEVRWAWYGDAPPVRTDAEGHAILSGAASDEEAVHVALPDGTRFSRFGTLTEARGDRIDLELRLPRTRSLVVHVVDTSGAPVALASVTASRTASSPGTLSADEQWASADAKGLARLTSLVATSVRLRVLGAGFVTQELTVDGTATSAGVTLEAMGAASARRWTEAREALERLESEIRAQDPSDDSDEALARLRRQQELHAECNRLRGR
jgi:hypothetical protein